MTTLFIDKRPPGPQRQTVDDSWVWHLVANAEEADDAMHSAILAMQSAGYVEHDTYAVQIALEEAVSNALNHGNRNDPSKIVLVRCQVTRDYVLVEVEDQGDGFDLGPFPDTSIAPACDRLHGRGIYLMRYFMTSVQYSARGNLLRMVKYRSVQ